MAARGGDFYTVVPIHEPANIWDRILAALSPARWARAFAGWMIEGVHGTLCGVGGAGLGRGRRELRGRVDDERHPHRHPTRSHLRGTTWCSRRGWSSGAIASGALVVILGWMGLSLIVSEHLGRQQSGWREMVPRLVLGLVAAASSLWWCALVLDVADAVSGFVAASSST